MKHFLKKYRHPLLFVVVFSGICLYYNFHEIYQFGPRSFHQWRQSDSASTAFNYYQDGLNFFKPRVHYAMGGEGYVTGAGESPIFYYYVAIFYTIFGPEDGIFRLLSLLILLAGFYYLSKIILEQTLDLLVSIFVTAILMTSPVIAYYSFNFTPNIPAQGIAMIGIWFFYLFYQKSQLKFFYWSMFFCAFAGLLKISALIPFFVILGLWLVEVLNIIKLKKEKKLFAQNGKTILAFLMVFVIIFLWKSFADYYNEIHQTNYFLSKIRPIWSLDETARQQIWDKIITNRFASFFNPITFWTIVVVGCLIIVTPRKHNRALYFAFLLTLAGSISFFLLMFKQFEVHDYYAIEMMLLPIIILCMAFFYTKKRYSFILKKWWFRGLLLAALAYNINYAKSHINSIYDQKNYYMSHFNSIFYKKKELQHFIKTLGIQSSDKVISAPDWSPNKTLYYLNLRGWTEYFLGGNQLNSLVMEYLIASNARYLILNDKKYLEIEDLKPYLDYPLGAFENSIFVFDIRPYKLKEIEIITN